MRLSKTWIIVGTLLLCITGTTSARTNGFPAASRNSSTAVGGPSWIASSFKTTGGPSRSASAKLNARAEFAGQSHRPISLVVHAATDMVNEGDSIQLSATLMLRDRVLHLPRAASVVWTVISGPVAALSPSGMLTTDSVYQNEVIIFQGWYAGNLATGMLIVRDSNPDNYGSYGSDGIDDDWQVGHFGAPPNENASPTANPDGDPNNNLMEFLTGFDPMDPNEWFQVVIMDCDGSTATLCMNKVIPNRLYTVQAGTGLENFPESVLSFSSPVEELDKVVEDTGFTIPKKFYRVDVTRL